MGGGGFGTHTCPKGKLGSESIRRVCTEFVFGKTVRRSVTHSTHQPLPLRVCLCTKKKGFAHYIRSSLSLLSGVHPSSPPPDPRILTAL